MIVVSAVLLTVTSCQKEQVMSLKSEEGVNISIRGTIDDYLPAGDKAAIQQVARVMWEEGDIVYAYDRTQKLGELTVSLNSGSARYAYLTSVGQIAKPEGNTITLVYAAGCESVFNDGKLTFDLSDQDGKQTAFVLYATLPYDGSDIINNEYVPFRFATSVMKVHCTGLEADGSISWAAVYGVDNTCQLTLSSDGEPVVAGINNGMIAKTGADAFEASPDGRATFTIAVVASAQSSARKILVRKSNTSNTKEYESKFAAAKIETGFSYTSVFAFTERKFETVKIGDLEWAKDNLAITPSGFKEFNRTGHINGDYFQWAEYAGYAGAETDNNKGLLIYTSFNSTLCGDNKSMTDCYFEFKKDKDGIPMVFRNNVNGRFAPYIKKEDGSFTKYDTAGEQLESTDDAATIILGEGWRIPTLADFTKLINATYWKYDSDDFGWYVYTPEPSSDKGKMNAQGTGTYNKQDALLFFAIGGHGTGDQLWWGDPNYGVYWTSTLYVNNSAYDFFMTPAGRSVDVNGRQFGNQIRPVRSAVTE